METVRKYGSVPFSIAVIHGGPGAGGEMAPIARELSLDWGILEPIQTASSIEGQIEELKQGLVKYAKLPVTLIGFSWGAWLSIMFATDYPGFVKKLILVGCGPFEEKYANKVRETRLNRLSTKQRNEYFSIITMLNDNHDSRKDTALKHLEKLTKQTDAFSPLIEDSEQSDSILFNGSIHQTVWSQAAQLRKSGDLLKRVKQVKCPTVAVHGDYDPHPAEGVEKPLSRLLQDFRFYLLKKCGHEPWREQYAKAAFFALLRNEL
ncbi:MAG: alpha/beta fold hydrolase [Candidatus Heimdallarchaeota archaeon]